MPEGAHADVIVMPVHNRRPITLQTLQLLVMPGSAPDSARYPLPS